MLCRRTSHQVMSVDKITVHLVESSEDIQKLGLLQAKRALDFEPGAAISVGVLTLLAPAVIIPTLVDTSPLVALLDSHQAQKHAACLQTIKQLTGPMEVQRYAYGFGRCLISCRCRTFESESNIHVRQ